jgi:hypothetical protein
MKAKGVYSIPLQKIQIKLWSIKVTVNQKSPSLLVFDYIAYTFFFRDSKMEPTRITNPVVYTVPDSDSESDSEYESMPYM